METQVKQYKIKYRNGLMQPFLALEDSETTQYDTADSIARNFALQHPDTQVQIISNTEGFEYQYRYKSVDGRLYCSTGHGWYPYE